MRDVATTSNAVKRKVFLFHCRGHQLSLGKETKIMGILNVTPDSFSKDGVYKDPERTKEMGIKMAEDGADIIDIGGESTRPGAGSVSVQEEKERVLPAIKRLAREIKIPISIDTSHAETAKAALDEGASIVNDISAFRFDRQMSSLIARYNAGCIIMHIKGTPQTMQQNPQYIDLIGEIKEALKENSRQAQESGIGQNSIIIDPGIGFGKTTEHNLEMIKRLQDLASLELPILIGPSRKSFIGNVLGNLPVEKRLIGTIAAVVAGILNGAHIVRVHDVREVAQAAKMADAISESQKE